MKPFAWVQNAVQALASDARGNLSNHDSEQDSDLEYYKEDEILRINSKNRKSNSLPKSRGGFSLIRGSRNIHHFESPVDVWNDSTTSLDQLQLSVANAAAKSPSNTWTLAGDGSVREAKHDTPEPTSTEPSKEPLNDASLSFEYNPAVEAYISDSYPPKPSPSSESRTERPQAKPPNRSSNSSTIFQNSPRMPITITLTAPDDEAPADSDPPQRNSFNDIRNIRNSLTPLPLTKPLFNPSPTTLPMQPIDRSRLMPPNEHIFDARRTQKTHEFREIRGFMISFMNMKGAMFPEQLRTQMMDMYDIQEADLHPETVAKFYSKDSFLEHCQDEGVMLNDMGNSKQHLKILETAFRSRMEEVTPKRKIVSVPAIRPQQTPKQITGPGKPNLRSRSETAIATFADEDNMPLAWLAPMISTSASDLAPLPHSLTKTRSTPNLGEHALQHQRNPTVSNPGTPTEVSQKLFQEGDPTRSRRNNRLSGAFGVMREAVLGRKKSTISR